MTTWECDTDSTGKTGDGSPRIKDPSSLTDSLALPLSFLVAFFDRVYSAVVCDLSAAYPWAVLPEARKVSKAVSTLRKFQV